MIGACLRRSGEQAEPAGALEASSEIPAGASGSQPGGSPHSHAVQPRFLPNLLPHARAHAHAHTLRTRPEVRERARPAQRTPPSSPRSDCLH
jgi:hypothetical protein